MFLVQGCELGVCNTCKMRRYGLWQKQGVTIWIEPAQPEWAEVVGPCKCGNNLIVQDTARFRRKKTLPLLVT